MVRLPNETLEFLRAEPGEVVARMAVLAADHRGWVNLRPLVHEPEEEEEADRPPSLFGAFSASGPVVPLCTWTPGERRRRSVEPAAVGIQHAAGPKAARRLAASAVPVPEGWAVVQDHPRRGLVVRPPAGVELAAVLAWLLGAGEVLCRPPVSGWWTAAVFGPEG